MVSSGETHNEVASNNKLQVGQPDASEPILDDVGNVSQRIAESGIHASQSNLEGRTAPTIPEKASQEPDAGSHILRIDQEGSISAIPEKVSESPDGGSITLQSSQHESTPPIIREKVSEDGYQWRKYGQKYVKCRQKIVKGNELIRSYYKCTHPRCLVKKQLEISLDGQIINTISFGHHDHPKPRDNLPVDVGVVEEKRDKSSLSCMEERQKPHEIEATNTPQLSSTVASKNDVKVVLSDSSRTRYKVDTGDSTGAKRTKKRNRKGDATLMDKPTSEPRTVVQTSSEVDILNDGYRWRKYGQKLVKGNPNPRSYYRCSTYGCPAKKLVERAAHDPALVITTYEGQHVHDVPPARRVAHNPASSDANHRDDSGTKPVESFASCLDMVVSHTDRIANAESTQQVKSKSRKLERSSVANFDTVSHSSMVHECKSNGKHNVKSASSEVNNASDLDMAAHSSSGSKGGLDEQCNGESGTRLNEIDGTCPDMVVHANPVSPNAAC
ncbi:WRKY transcription factor 1-like [Tripterygium wilfordii]|uniref:WRKY transcription factor 1-like n=1 Tax=Tripterygium wilfordii TaxID=458696 RepID=UPI0018F80546|nr:WRKY transcription factor 1-like [Tripterygium wilfordii]